MKLWYDKKELHKQKLFKQHMITQSVTIVGAAILSQRVRHARRTTNPRLCNIAQRFLQPRNKTVCNNTSGKRPPVQREAIYVTKFLQTKDIQECHHDTHTHTTHMRSRIRLDSCIMLVHQEMQKSLHQELGLVRDERAAIMLPAISSCRSTSKFEYKNKSIILTKTPVIEDSPLNIIHV